MNKKGYLALVVVVLLLLVWFVIYHERQTTNKPAVSSETTNTYDTATSASGTSTPPPSPMIEATFVSTSSEQVQVVFNNTLDQALLTGLGYTDHVLPRAVSGSGARYEDATSSLVLWNKGDEVTITKDGQTLFVGTATTSRKIPAVVQ